MPKKQIIMIIAGIVAGIGIVAGAVALNRKEEPEPPATVKQEQEPEHAGEAKSLLTGEWAPEAIAKSRPIAVMTENTKQALPQYGLSQAGIIYEAPVEGSYTRLMAIYDDLGDMEKVGNVRSCRPYYAYFAAEFDAVYVHYGQSIHAESLLSGGLVNNLSGLDGSIEKAVFYRTKDRKAPHNAYTSAEGVKKGMEIKGYRSEYAQDYPGHYRFAEDNVPETLSQGTDAVVVKPYYFYNKPHFVYHSDDGLYYRYQFGGEQTDGNNQEPLAVRNIIFQNVRHSIYEQTEYLNLTLTGSGEGKYFTNGKMIDITWKKDDERGITHYYDAAGQEITLNQGKTWVCIIQDSYADKSLFYATEEEFSGNGQ